MSLSSELKATWDDIKDAWSFKNIPNMGLRIPVRLADSHYEARPTVLRKEAVEGSIYLVQQDNTYYIGLADVGSSNGEDAQRLKRLSRKYRHMSSVKDMMSISFIKSFILEYSKESERFSFTQDDINSGRKVIKYYLLLDDTIQWNALMCSNRGTDVGLLFQFRNLREGILFSQQLKIETASIIDQDWDLIEEVSLHALESITE